MNEVYGLQALKDTLEANDSYVRLSDVDANRSERLITSVTLKLYPSPDPNYTTPPPASSRATLVRGLTSVTLGGSRTQGRQSEGACT